ncbi:MAG: hypothetical protein ABIL09_27920, partial [Gemmatimonadota bacterium]
MSRPAESGAWELPEFLLATWGGPQVASLSARAAGLAAAGMNTVRWDLADLEALRGHGLRAIVDGAGPADAARLRDEALVWGYHLMDEPETDRFPEIARQVEAFRRADPHHPAYVNLFARAGDHAAAFIETVRPAFLSYDYYQWWYGPYQQYWEGSTGYFSRLEQHRDAARAAGIPLVNWVEVVANRHDDRYRNVPLPSDSGPKVRQSLYTGLAYGVKGVQWFHGGLLYEEGTAALNECGRHVAALNAELRALGPVLLRLESAGVFHTPPLPRGTRAAPAQHWVLPEGGELVLGVFRDRDGGDYLLAPNRRADSGCGARLVVQGPLPGLLRLDRGRGAWVVLPLGRRADRADA